MTEPHRGSCFCSAVEFEVSGAPVVMGYCHCTDCATWAAAPVSSFGLWPWGSVQITKGVENIGAFNKTEKARRKFCRTCGGHVITEFPALKLVEVYPNIVPGLPHNPTMHVHYAAKTVSIKDGLPKFRDLPANFGGSGELLPE